MLKNYFIKNWKEFLGTAPLQNIQLVPISSCTDEYGNDIILIFIETDNYPRYVMKICKDWNYNFKIKREYLALTYLKNNTQIGSKIPTPYHLGEFARQVFFLQEGLSGISLYSLIKKSGLNKTSSALIEKSIDLLIQINCVTIPDKSDKTCDLLFDFEHVLSKAAVCQAQISRIKSECEIFVNQEVRYFLHGDFWLRNVIINEKSKDINGIIDWEFSMMCSPFPIDIMWFLINLGYCLAQTKWYKTSIFDAFKWAFFSHGKHNNFIGACFTKYALNMGIDKKSFFALMEILLVEMSLREYRAYGKHRNMDNVCLDMLKYLHDNKSDLCFP